MADADALREAGVPSRLPAAEPLVTSPGAAPLTPAPPAPTPAAPPAEEKVMTLVDHLTELRNRIFISVIAVAIGAAIGFYYSTDIIHLLKGPLPPDPTTGLPRALNFLGPSEAFFVYVKIAFAVGIIFGLPVIVYEGWRFISPGLTPQERKIARPWVPIAAVFFLIGIAVAWVVLPFALQFLVGFENADFHYLPTADAYFGFVTTLFLAFGLTMEFPIALVLLSKVGIITSQRLRSSRRVVILGIAVFSAVVTPGGDLVSPTVLGVVMYLLFELSIRLVKWGGH